MSNAYIVFNGSLLIYPVRQKNARGMRKAILLSKRTSSLPQGNIPVNFKQLRNYNKNLYYLSAYVIRIGLHAPQGSHDLHPKKTAKKGAYFSTHILNQCQE